VVAGQLTFPEQQRQLPVKIAMNAAARGSPVGGSSRKRGLAAAAPPYRSP